jgi:hypothetical protein
MYIINIVLQTTFSNNPSVLAGFFLVICSLVLDQLLVP